MSQQIAQAGSTTMDRVALIVVTLVGMALCTRGVGKVAVVALAALKVAIAAIVPLKV